MRNTTIAIGLLLLLGIGAGASPSYAKNPRLPRPVGDADFHYDAAADAAKAGLGRLLFFDKILSGNRNISCATCHHALTDTGDGLSLPLGEGGEGLGVIRNPGVVDPVHERIPRNAPPIFNLGAREFTVMFHDGRVFVDDGQPSGFVSPAGDDLPGGLDNALAAQAMFPVTSVAEMAGQAGENPVGTAAAAGDVVQVWALLAERLRGVQEYRDRFLDVYGIAPGEITFVHAANAIAAFEGTAWRADQSPFDRFLRGDQGAMTRDAKAGMKLFYGRTGCSSCHGGPFQTDHAFHAVAMPQIGPGKGDGDDGRDDFGRERVTGDPNDRYRFRTPSLRNVALTGPWGHDGAYNSLAGVVRHMLDPVARLRDYDKSQCMLPPRPDLDALDFVVMHDPGRVDLIAGACELDPVELAERELAQLIAFLNALTDPRSLDLRSDVPMRVPSGLPLAETP